MNGKNINGNGKWDGVESVLNRRINAGGIHTSHSRMCIDEWYWRWVGLDKGER